MSDQDARASDSTPEHERHPRWWQYSVLDLIRKMLGKPLPTEEEMAEIAAMKAASEKARMDARPRQQVVTVKGTDPRDLDRKIASTSKKLARQGYSVRDISRQTTSMNFGAHHRATIVAHLDN